MKKLFFTVAAAVAATMMIGCGTTSFSTSNTSGILTDVNLSEANFHVIKNVTGKSSVTYVLGIGGMSDRAVSENAVEQMIRSAKLKDSQAITNVYVKTHVATVLGLITKITYTATGIVIEFYGEGKNPHEKGKTPPANEKAIFTSPVN